MGYQDRTRSVRLRSVFCQAKRACALVNALPDGKSYVYSDYRILSDLYLVSGLR
jgi:hypothetical protein